MREDWDRESGMKEESPSHLQRAAARGAGEVFGDFVRDEIDFERISAALRDQVRAHPVRSLVFAALGGLVVGKILRRV